MAFIYSALHSASTSSEVVYGGMGDINEQQDYGFMYSRSLIDLDGHVCGPMWMDPAAKPFINSELALGLKYRRG